MTSKMSVKTDDPEVILEYEERDRQKVFDAAESLGCKVIIAQPNELQLDIDKPWEFKDTSFEESTLTRDCWRARKLIGRRIWDSFSQEIYVLSLSAWRSRNGNIHIVLKLSQEYSAFERIIFQSILGSDPRRELLNWKRINDGSENPIALFRPKETICG